jgi:16S rRNA G966 N2-methylase RsmD
MDTPQGYSSSEEHAFWEQWYHQHYHDEVTLSDIYFMGERLYRDRHACAIYGHAPDEAYQKGIRLTGHTLIEYCIDGPAQVIAWEVQSYLQRRGLHESVAVVDLFAGSGNLLYHVAHTLCAKQACGVEADPVVAALTARNFALIESPWQVTHGTWHDFDPAVLDKRIQTVVILIDPPWGRGHTSAGLDLRATEPPVPEVLTTLLPRLQQHVVWVIKTYEQTVPESLEQVAEYFEDYQYDTLGRMAAGTNVGYLIGLTQCREETRAVGTTRG